MKKKLRTTHTGLIALTLVLIAALLAARGIWGEQAFYWLLGTVNLLWAPVHLVVMIRTRNPAYLVTGLYFLLVGLTFFPPLYHHALRPVFAAGAGASLIPFFWVLISKRINWRYREILEMAAQPVDDTADGFTPRPFPAGRAEYTRAEVLDFSRFLLKHVVAYPYFEEGRVVLIVPCYMFAYLLLFKRDYREDTHVVFDDSGRVSVRISEKDYRTYKEALTFDQLCASLAKVFVRFLEMHRSGRRKEIIAQLNAV